MVGCLSSLNLRDIVKGFGGPIMFAHDVQGTGWEFVYLNVYCCPLQLVHDVISFLPYADKNQGSESDLCVNGSPSPSDRFHASI